MSCKPQLTICRGIGLLSRIVEQLRSVLECGSHFAYVEPSGCYPKEAEVMSKYTRVLRRASKCPPKLRKTAESG